MTYAFATLDRDFDRARVGTPPSTRNNLRATSALLDLQRLAGNRAVVSLLSREIHGRSAPALQRCGATPPGECSCALPLPLRATLGGQPVPTLQGLDESAARTSVAAVQVSTWEHPVAISRQQTPVRRKEGCPAYEVGEVRQSRTGEGHLPRDVHETVVAGSQVLLVGDFGVGRADIKESARKEPRLNEWLSLFAGNDTYHLELEGSTDCVGRPGTNSRLKRARAGAFLDLLDESTRSRAVIVDSGPGTYVVDNGSPQGRAANRSVAVLIRASADIAGEQVMGERRTPRQIIEHARAVYRRKGARADEDWTFYGSLTMLRRPWTDDRYVDGWIWQNYGSDAARQQVKNLRDEILKSIDPNLDDETNYKALEALRSQIEQSLAYADLGVLSTGGRSAMSDCHMRIIRWLKLQQESTRSIYFTWKDAYVPSSSGSLGLETPC